MVSFGVMLTRLRAPIGYFFMVYVGWFTLDTIREVVITPAVGLTAALFVEMVLLVIISFFSARFVLDRSPEARTPSDRLFVGCTAFILLLIAEETMQRILRGISVFTLWVDFSPIAALANIASLGLFILMPWIIGVKPDPIRPG